MEDRVILLVSSDIAMDSWSPFSSLNPSQFIKVWERSYSVSTWGFLDIARVVTHAGKIPGKSFSNISVLKSDCEYLPRRGFWTLTLSPAKSFPNTKEMPRTGQLFVTPIDTTPFITSDCNSISQSGTLSKPPPIPWTNTESPVNDSDGIVTTSEHNNDWAAPVSLRMITSSAILVRPK